jgi:hypothetical protein
MLKFDHNVPVPPSRSGRKTKMESDEMRDDLSKMKRGDSVFHSLVDVPLYARKSEAEKEGNKMLYILRTLGFKGSRKTTYTDHGDVEGFRIWRIL